MPKRDRQRARQLGAKRDAPISLDTLAEDLAVTGRMLELLGRELRSISESLNRSPQNLARVVRPCEVCGEPIRNRRRDARTCSDACRTALSRARRANAADQADLTDDDQDDDQDAGGGYLDTDWLRVPPGTP
jgi:RNA polymerase-binding transcription factor DksA